MEQLIPWFPALRVGSNRVSVTVAATTTALATLTGTMKAVIRKLRVYHARVGNIMLELGYATNAFAPVWTPVLPAFLCLTGIDNDWTELELPVAGNTPFGFQIDTTPNTGFAGVIACQASAAGVAPNNILVSIEFEAIG